MCLFTLEDLKLYTPWNNILTYKYCLSSWAFHRFYPNPSLVFSTFMSPSLLMCIFESSNSFWEHNICMFGKVNKTLFASLHNKILFWAISVYSHNISTVWIFHFFPTASYSSSPQITIYYMAILLIVKDFLILCKMLT